MNDAYHALIRGERTGLWATLQRSGLWTFSLGYRIGAAVRNLAFDRGWIGVHRASVPVVSIGNLTTGGTGKTPCVEHVAKFYRDIGLQVAILSRGYGSETGRNDEAMVLEENLPDVPHLQGADRVALSAIAIEELESEVLVLDDGFQHRRLHRDLDLVLIDATCPWGHDYLLPRGLLREPIENLRRADMVVISRCDLATDEQVRRIRELLLRIKPEMPIAESIHRPAMWRNAEARTLPVESMTNRPVAAFCGLGNPEAFRHSLLGLGLELTAWRSYPDHHDYTRKDVEDLRFWARQLPQDAAVVTTQKDLVKLRLDLLGDREVWALQICLHFRAGQDLLEGKLRKAVAGVL